MNGRLVWRVMWKEYRALRGLWLAVAVASWLAQVAVLSSTMDLGLMEVAYAAALVTPVFYVFGAAAAVFAGEREDGADRLLLALPTPLPSLAAGKMAFVALSTLALIPAAGVLAFWALSQPAAEPARLQQDVSSLAYIWAPAVLEGFVWGLFFSLLCRNVMQAACLATLAAAVSVSVALHLSSRTAIDGVDATQYAETLWPRLGIVLVVLAADLVLVRRWLAERQPAALDMAHEQTRQAGWLDRLTQWMNRTLRWQARLTWQQLRLSTRTMALVIVLPMTVPLLLPRLSEGARIPELSRTGVMTIDLAWEATLVVLATLIGSMAFAADKRYRSYRCLAEQGCGAGAVWFNRQTLGLACLVGAVALWHLAWWLRFGRFDWPVGVFAPLNNYGYHSGERIAWNVMSWREVGLVAVCYAAGQLASLLFTSSLISALVGLVLAAFCYAWSALMLYLQLPPALTVWPLAVGMLATTAVFARGWLLDQRGARTWLLSGGTLALFGGGTLALIPELRLDGLPDPPLAFDLDAFQATLSPEAQQTADLYRRAVETMRTRREIEEQVAPPNPDTGEGEPLQKTRDRWDRGELSAVDRAWLAANAEPVRLVLEANERPTSAFVRPLVGFEGRSLYDLADVLLLRGLLPESNLETRLAAYADVLAMVEHLRPDYSSFREAQAIERRTLTSLLRWAALPGQTPQSLREARRVLESRAARTPGIDQVMKWQYLEVLREIEAPDPEYSFWLNRFLTRLPWERTRAVRLLNAWTNNSLEVINQALVQMSPATLEHMHGFGSFGDENLRIFGTPALRVRLESHVYSGHALAQQALERATRMRAAILALELMAVRLEKGELPATLADLVCDDFKSVPLDPFTAGPFEYFPHGVPVKISQYTQLGDDIVDSLKVGPPSLWSPGDRVRVTIRQENGQPVRHYSYFWGDHWESIDSALAWWKSGLIFALPQPTPAP